MSFDDNWLDIIRREAAIVAAGHHVEPSILVATGYDPDKHAVKGILQPHGVETGWVALPTMHVGNGWGIAVGPQIGTAEDLKGDQFHVAFLNGDPNTPIAVGRHYVVDKDNKPPRVKSGEIIIKHEKGMTLFMNEDGDTTYTGSRGQSIFFDHNDNAVYTGAKGQTITKDSDGNLVAALQGGNKLDLQSGGDAILRDKDGKGIVRCTNGKVRVGDMDASDMILTLAGPAKNAFAKA